jgi:hypothetical protein
MTQYWLVRGVIKATTHSPKLPFEWILQEKRISAKTSADAAFEFAKQINLPNGGLNIERVDYRIQVLNPEEKNSTATLLSLKNHYLFKETEKSLSKLSAPAVNFSHTQALFIPESYTGL